VLENRIASETTRGWEELQNSQPLNDYRHPVLVAREMATVDLLTEGRLQLGLGAGYMHAEYEEAGFRFEAGGRRVARLAEAVRLIKGLCTGAPVTFVGQHYHVRGHQLQPLPVQRPHPPLLIGGNGPRLLTLAAQAADIVGLTGITLRPGGTGPWGVLTFALGSVVHEWDRGW
jgi:alkanesulfonate monooxygenase SsuD/methylene tetrahydromethanopterin reductase-like flavin-dependent oxidoreductase (luciferase family)